jgi:putative N6-adenine-specific DNA methylase
MKYMKNYELIATTTFGLEAVVKRELIDLGFEVTRTENGKVTFLGDESGIIKANLYLRCADRVLLKVTEFKALTFDELFEKTKQIDWSYYIPKNGKFPVDGQSVKSQLASISDSQAIVKKAIVESLKNVYHQEWFSEDGAIFGIKVSILNDIATLTIDTSGVALHKRGYRINAVTAPLKETLAAALVLLSFWNKDRILIDPFTGSGTIPIEAAMIAKNIPPGLNRDFACKYWPIIPEELWRETKNEAYLKIDQDVKLNIKAFDISQENISAAIENADEAGVLENIKFEKMDFYEYLPEEDYSIMITNPPYGERLADTKEADKLYSIMGIKLSKLKTWSMYVITSDQFFEKKFQRKANRRRILFNGRIKTTYYQFHGQQPKKQG